MNYERGLPVRRLSPVKYRLTEQPWALVEKARGRANGSLHRRSLARHRFYRGVAMVLRYPPSSGLMALLALVALDGLALSLLRSHGGAFGPPGLLISLVV